MSAGGGVRADQDFSPGAEDGREDSPDDGPDDDPDYDPDYGPDYADHGADSPDFGALDPAVALMRLENQLNRAIRYGDRMNQALFRLMSADLEAAHRRAERAESQLAALRGSPTYRVGRLVTAVPARVRRRLRPRRES